MTTTTTTTKRAAPAAKSSRKSSTKAAPPASPATEAPDTGDSGIAMPDLKQADLKKKDLIDLVVTRSGIKKKDAKPVVEAMLAILGETLGSGRDLNLPPMGKLRINRTKEKPGYRVIISKLRQTTGARIQPDTPLAEPTE